MENKVYDIAGVGIGPFNLGLAALAQPTQKLDCVFFDKKTTFSWHPGLMFDFAKLQVPFYADLVTGADPSNPYSFLCYMKKTGRLFQFAILEDNYITRKEYNAYCCWVAAQLNNLFFGHEVVEIEYSNPFNLYKLTTKSLDGKLKVFRARRIVLGVGSVPFVPNVVQGIDPKLVFHSSQYLPNREALLKNKSIMVVGSGQSAAEIFYDILHQPGPRPKQLDWITRADRLFPMDISKFSLEMTSPDYIDYFHDLPQGERESKLKNQDVLYKGINQELLNDIYRLLYYNDEKEVVIRTSCELKHIVPNGEMCEAKFYHAEQKVHFSKTTNAIVLATGYRRIMPNFIHGIKSKIQWEEDRYLVNRNYSIDENKSEIFVQNADLHSHGFNAPDLGMGTYRNAMILNTILEEDYFMIEKKIAFQSFGV